MHLQRQLFIHIYIYIIIPCHDVQLDVIRLGAHLCMKATLSIHTDQYTPQLNSKFE